MVTQHLTSIDVNNVVNTKVNVNYNSSQNFKLETFLLPLRKDH